eukprot:13042870-Heterocapsa_arctica.AAC.1
MASIFSFVNVADIMNELGDLSSSQKKSKKEYFAELRASYQAPTTDMPVLVGFDEIGEVRMKIKNATELKTKANICCKDAKKCMLCKAAADTNDVKNYKIQKSHTQGIESFLEEQKEKNRWKEATNEQKMMM